MRFISLHAGWLALLLALAGVMSAAEFHVAPDGSSQHDGSPKRPWDLATALAAPAAVKPGDTIWLHAGTYRGGFQSKLTGQPNAPIVVRARPGERVTIDTHPRDERDHASLFLHGADTVYRDFEVTCSHENRVTKTGGSWPADIRRGSVDIRGSRISAINLVVHDQGVGFGFWRDGEGGEISGCLIYNNGWQGPDRAHGHGIYTQNARGTKRIADNIVFHQFAYGIHGYGSEKAALEGFEIEGNICFENGALSRDGSNAPGIMFGGGCPVARTTVRGNVVIGGAIRLGYPWGTTNDDAIVTGNYCDHGLILRDFRKATVKNNTITAASNVVQLEGAEKLMTGGLAWDENEYFVTEGRWGECSVIEEGKSRGMTFDQWKQTTGCDAKTRFTKASPTKLRVVVRPNAHERGRANIAIVNSQSLPEVEVDLSSVLTAGDRYRIVSAKDFFGASLVEGQYDGKPVRVPMKPVATPPPIGVPDAKLPQTEPRFGAFVVLRK